jgi:hypothetical protein
VANIAPIALVVPRYILLKHSITDWKRYTQLRDEDALEENGGSRSVSNS